MEGGLSLGRLLLLLLETVALALLGPSVPLRRPGSHLPATDEEYLALLLPCTLVALLVAVAAGYEYIAKPLKTAGWATGWWGSLR